MNDLEKKLICSEVGAEILLYQAENGEIRIETRLQNDTIWLTEPLMAELYQTTQQNISQDIQNIYEEGELLPEATHKKFLSVRQEGQLNRIPMTMQDWIERLNQFLTMTGRELLTHAGTISHESAIEKVSGEYDKFRAQQLDEPTEVEKHFVKAEEKIKRIATKRGEKHE